MGTWESAVTKSGLSLKNREGERVRVRVDLEKYRGIGKEKEGEYTIIGKYFTPTYFKSGNARRQWALGRAVEEAAVGT